MPVFAINQPITTKVPTVTVDNSFTAGSSHTFQLVVVNSAGIQSDPVQVTVQVAAVLLASPKIVAPPVSQAAKKRATKVEPAKTVVQAKAAKATPPKAPAKAGVIGKPDKAPITPVEPETVTPVQVGPVKREPAKPADQAEVVKAAPLEAPPTSSLSRKRRRPTTKTPVTPEETQPVKAKPVKGAPGEVERAKPGPAEDESAGKKSTRHAAKKPTRKKSS